jgi:hypothetical protein
VRALGRERHDPERNAQAGDRAAQHAPATASCRGAPPPVGGRSFRPAWDLRPGRKHRERVADVLARPSHGRREQRGDPLAPGAQPVGADAAQARDARLRQAVDAQQAQERAVGLLAELTARLKQRVHVDRRLGHGHGGSLSPGPVGSVCPAPRPVEGSPWRPADAAHLLASISPGCRAGPRTDRQRSGT